MTMLRPRYLIAVLFTLTSAASACLFSLAPAAQATTSHAVMMAQYAFAPSALTVHVGDSVSWTNHDQAPHNVVTTSAPVSINSPMLSDGQSWSYTFTTPGTYQYVCGVHPDMHATVVVEAAAPTTRPRPAPSTTSPKPVIAMPASHASTAPKPAKAASASSATAPAATPSTTPAAAGAGANPPMSAMPVVAPVAQSSGVSTARLKPLLLIAGVIAAVTVFCLLSLASRPRQPTD